VLGTARQARRSWPRRGGDRSGMAGQAGHQKARRRCATHREVRQAGHGEVGKTRQAGADEDGESRLGTEWQGLAGEDWLGGAVPRMAQTG